ncbi:MAG TPA: TIGR03118 family protein [Chthoniobacterales bacterium]|nr:TIGR03118 family protein [Chthoniobacterales bacterium]
MKRNSHLDPGLLRRRALSFVSACVLASPAALLAQQYQQTNLVSDLGTLGAQTVDPKLKNPWGIARGPSGNPWWVSDERSGVSTLYNAQGTPANPLNPGGNGLVVTIPPSVPPPAVGTPTGVVFNGSTNDFRVAPPGVAQTFFLFVSLDGSISGWDPAANPTTAITKVSTHSVLTGATIAQIGADRFLYVADLKAGKIRVYDTNFNPVEVGETEVDDKHGEHAFEDEQIPKGFAPFNIQNIGGNLYVAYAKQDQAKTFVTSGAGLGFVDVFSPQGSLLLRLQHGNWFNAPWGLTLAPSDFGTFSHRILVGQFGSGEILAFDAVTGQFQGKLNDQNNQVIAMTGLWGLAFGAGDQTSGAANTLFFNEGLNGGNGLFGTLTPIATDIESGNGQ